MKVSLISTVKNAVREIESFLASVRAQTRRPNEILIVDGGSTDGTLELLRAADDVTLIEEPGANIPTGRAIAIRKAQHDLIAVSDADCVLTPRWLEALAGAIERGADVAMGTYRPIPRTFFEACAAATRVPDLDEIDERTFLPSSRSVAFTRQIYEEAGGYPEWLDVGEDMYLDLVWRKMGARMVLVPEAVTKWRPRPTLRDTWRQYRNYARGDALAGMHPRRHAVRFTTYAGAPLLARRPWGRVAILVGAVFYAARPIRRAWHLLDDPLHRAGALLAVPALMAWTDAANMTGYLQGLVERRRRRRLPVA